MEKGYIYSKMGLNTMESGKMMIKMGKDFSYLQMGISIKVILRKGSNQEKEYITILTEIDMKENGRQIKEMVMVYYG